ncbi:MAG: Ser-Thr-rich GPI-anchored membrane family protein [Candidatus Marinimicrobia bacterium]|nr:Ser-Thr-rich GPI-anchored membrane family protein [Candidatus Neomarinimicrobiota bacterium]
MGNSIRSILFYIIIASAILLIPGCPELIDIFPPELTILEPTGEEPVESTFNVKLDVTDNDEVESVEIIILDGGAEIAQQTLSAEPWETSFTVNDTGNVTLEAKATDAMGNFVNEELSLQVIGDAGDDGSSLNITVTSPNGGENWEPGTTKTISWNSENLSGSYVGIQLYRIGSYVSSIISATYDNGSYTWSIPNSQTESDYYRIKIYDYYDESVYDLSDNYFTIGESSSSTPSITVTSPNGGENWEPGSNETITWTSSNLSTSCRIFINLFKSGLFDRTIVGGSGYYGSSPNDGTSNDGSYTWSIPSSLDESSEYGVTIIAAIFITDADYGDYWETILSDYSDNYFTIEESSSSTPSITVTSPNGGEEWGPGGSQTITWDSENLSGSSVGISLYRSGSYVSSISSGTGDDGNYSWSISSSQTESDYYKVKIYSTSESSISDYSDNYFIIEESSGGSNPIITVTSPNGGENIERGNTYGITWDSENLSGNYVGIQLYISGSQIANITGYTTDDGYYDWSIHTGQTESNMYQIKIYDYYDDSVYDLSDNYFTIEAATPSITVTSPNGYEDWEPGTSHSITWDSANLSGNYVGIQLYRSGSYVSSISSSTTDDGSYSWSISSSQTESDYYKVKIYSTSESSISDYSDNYFTIEEPTSSSCNTPTNLQTYSITTTSAVLDWGTVPTAISYNVMYRENGQSWDISYDINTSGANWDGLSANTTYQWQVQSACGSSTTSSWSSIITFTTPDDGGGGGSNADCDDPHYCSDCDGCESSCCPNYCSGFYYYYNRTCDGNGFCIGATSDYCPNGCNDNGCL